MSVEFECGRAGDMAGAMCDALIDYRLKRGASRAELHVLAGPDRWTDPAMHWADGGGYVHVINCADRLPPDPDGSNPAVRGTDYVLIVGPGAWHAEAVWAGVMGAVRHYNGIAGLCADVIEAIGSPSAMKGCP